MFRDDEQRIDSRTFYRMTYSDFVFGAEDINESFCETYSKAKI